MYLKLYQKYLIKNYLKILGEITAIFFMLIFILTLLEEINFFKEFDQNFFYPLVLTLLNTPAVIYDIFPFIFLISTQFFFIKINDKNEISIFKNNGINNFNLLKLLVLVSFLLALIINTVFYNLSSNLKYTYLDLKNKFSKDNKYLAVITENGLWIKDEINGKINIINSDKLVGDEIFNVEITQFNKEFILEKIIYTEKINIKDNTWVIKDAKISKDNLNFSPENELILKTNFNSKKLNSFFSNLNSLSFFELIDTKKSYKKLGYSTTEIEIHLQKFYTYPFYLTIMTLFSAIIMLNIKHNKPKIFHLILSILLSVVIYYINYFSNVLGQSLEISYKISNIIPILIITLSCGVGLVKINEK